MNGESTKRGPDPDVVVLSARPTHAVGIVGNCVCLIWRTAVVPEAVPSVAAAFAQAQRRAPDRPFDFVTVIQPDCNLHTPKSVRAGIAELLAEYGQQLSAAAIVHEAVGFQATVARSVITAISLMSNSHFPYRVFADLQAACQWVAQQGHGEHVAPTRMRAAVDRLR